MTVFPFSITYLKIVNGNSLFNSARDIGANAIKSASNSLQLRQHQTDTARSDWGRVRSRLERANHEGRGSLRPYFQRFRRDRTFSLCVKNNRPKLRSSANLPEVFQGQRTVQCKFSRRKDKELVLAVTERHTTVARKGKHDKTVYNHTVFPYNRVKDTNICYPRLCTARNDEN